MGVQFPPLPSSNFTGTLESLCGNKRKAYKNGRCVRNFAKSRCDICNKMEWQYEQQECRDAQAWARQQIAAEVNLLAPSRSLTTSFGSIEDLFDDHSIEDYYG